MCKKVDARIACEKCGYPLSDALYPDNWGGEPLDCNANDKEIKEYTNMFQDFRNNGE